MNQADGDSRAFDALVEVVLAAVAEVATPGVRGLFALSTLPSRRLVSIRVAAAPDRACTGAAVSAVCMSVALWASGATRFTMRTGMRALTVMLQAPCSFS